MSWCKYTWEYCPFPSGSSCRPGTPRWKGFLSTYTPTGKGSLLLRSTVLRPVLQMLNNHIPPNTGQTGHSYSPLFVMRPNFSQDNLSKLASLVDKIPPHSVTERLLNSCFDYCNWKFGLPKKWIFEAVAQTKDFLHYPASPLDACIHPGWLCLIFALLASAPPSISNDLGHNSELFFQCSLAALHNAEAMPQFSGFVSAKAPLEGSVLACLAVPLLIKRLAASGRLNEAWKLLGSSIRVAESLELHRDPGSRLWTDDEKYIRRLAWNNLVMWDRSVPDPIYLAKRLTSWLMLSARKLRSCRAERPGNDPSE